MFLRCCKWRPEGGGRGQDSSRPEGDSREDHLPLVADEQQSVVDEKNPAGENDPHQNSDNVVHAEVSHIYRPRILK